jgi:hypothetical protein
MMRVNLIFEFVMIIEINMLEIYLNNKLRQENSFSMELTWFPSNFQKTTKTSLADNLSWLDGNYSRQIYPMEFVNMEPQLGMTSASYFYEES